MPETSFYWDRGRPARNEREARKGLWWSNWNNLRACGALRAGRPRSQHRVLLIINLHQY